MSADTDWESLIPDEEVTPRETNVIHRQGTSRTGTTRRRTSSKRMTTLQDALSKEMFQAGAMIGFGLPVTGYYIAQEADNFTEAIIKLASKKAEWIDALEHISDIGPGITVGRTVLGIGAALGTDRFYRTNGQSGLDPDKQACAFLGVMNAYYEVHSDEREGSNASENGYVPPPHGAFVPVT